MKNSPRPKETALSKKGDIDWRAPATPSSLRPRCPTPHCRLLRAQEVDLQAQYAQLNAKFGSGYPKLREMQSQLSRLNSAIAAEGANVQTRLANEYIGAAKAEGMIRSEFDKQKDEAYRAQCACCSISESET